MPLSIPLPFIAPEPQFDPGAIAFVNFLRSDPMMIGKSLSADQVFELYSDYYGDGHGWQEPLSRGQLFRRIGAAGLRRFRQPTGKRLYRYRVTARSEPVKGQQSQGPTCDRLRTVHGPADFRANA
jgi:hypothetical protein